MNKFSELTKRNLKIYFRDIGAIFFSLLSMLVVILLMAFFLGDINAEGITNLLSQLPNRDIAADKENAELLVFAWTGAGILSINAVTVTLAAYSGMIRDKATGKLSSLYTSSASRFTIASSYVASAWTAAVLICIITLAIIEITGVFKGLVYYSFSGHLKLLGAIVVNSFVYATFMYLLSHTAKTEGAWSGIGTVIGTLVGFFGGIYIPIGQLSGTVGSIMKCTPVIYGSSMFRKIMTDTILVDTFKNVPQEVINEYREFMGIDLTLFDCDIAVVSEWLILISCGIIFLILSAVSLRTGKKADR